MADTVPCLVWVTQDDGSLTFLNDRWYETTGGTPEKSLGWGWFDFTHPEDRGRTVEAWQTCVREGKVLEIETRFRCADGGYRWFLSRGVPRRDDAGNIVEWFGTCTDIDAQKQTQAALGRGDPGEGPFPRRPLARAADAPDAGAAGRYGHAGERGDVRCLRAGPGDHPFQHRARSPADRRPAGYLADRSRQDGLIGSRRSTSMP